MLPDPASALSSSSGHSVRGLPAGHAGGFTRSAALQWDAFTATSQQAPYRTDVNSFLRRKSDLRAGPHDHNLSPGALRTPVQPATRSGKFLSGVARQRNKYRLSFLSF